MAWTVKPEDFEPGTVDVSAPVTHNAALSIAVSLKRIADALDPQANVNALTPLADQLSELRQAVWGRK